MGSFPQEFNTYNIDTGSTYNRLWPNSFFLNINSVIAKF